MLNHKTSSKIHLTIVLTGGGSGGHVTPILSLAQELKKQQPTARIVYIGHYKDEISLNNSIDKVYKLNSGKFRRYHGESWLVQMFDVKTFVLNSVDFFKVIFSTVKSIRLLMRVKPQVVFSKGSFVAVPVGIAARLLGVPIVTHDSDSVPGLANRIVGRWAKTHATGMPVEFYSYPKDKTVFVGVPVGRDIKPLTKTLVANYRKDLDLPLDAQVIVVAGGGNGALAVNNLMLMASRELLVKHPKLHILHLTGNIHESAVASEYKSILDKDAYSRVRVRGFVKDFYRYSGSADLVISRAGATAIAEYALQGKATIIIPSPHLVGGHQLKNANELAKTDSAVVLPNDTTPDGLIAVVNELLRDAQRRETLIRNISRFAKPDATSSLSKLILMVANRES